jgi:hypothetical protein
VTNRFHHGPKSFSNTAYAKVGLNPHEGSVGQARQQPLDYNQTESYQVSDDPMDMGVQRRLAGLTKRQDMHFPNPSGVAKLRAPDGRGILDIESTFEAIGLSPKTARLFESRNTDEVEYEAHQGRIAILRARREELQQELEAIDQRMAEMEENATAPMTYGGGKKSKEHSRYSKKALRRRKSAMGEGTFITRRVFGE